MIRYKTLSQRYVPTGGTHRPNGWDILSHGVGQLRTLCLLLLLMVVGTSEVWGLTEGLYYIKSNANQKYYLCPAIGCYYDNIDQPHLTTYQTNGDQNSIWEVKSAGSDDNYYLIHYKTGKYLKSNSGFSNFDGGDHRKAVHLEEKPSSLDESYEFYIKNNSGTYQIYPKQYDIDASSMSFNCRGGNQAYYVPQNGAASGIVGLYTYSGQPGSQWKFTAVAATSTPCATPIIKYDGDNINISYPYSDETGITIYYTTDGSKPTTSSSNKSSTSFNIPASDVIKVRAFATKTGLVNSDEAVLWGSSRPFLIQSKEDANYYLVPSANDGSSVNTSSIASEKMQWTLQNAGASPGGVPYYYLTNNNSKKVKYNTDNNTIAMDAGTADANKFCIVEDGNSDYFFLIPINGASTGDNKICKSVFKDNGNVASNNASAADVKANNNSINWSHWRFRVCNDGDDQKSLFTAPPFDISDTETNYYLISCAGTPSGYYIVPPDASSDYAMTSNTSDEYEEAPWMFKTAASDNWLIYYYIINAATGKYMYFDKNINSTSDEGQAEAICMKDFSEKTDDNADRFQFIFVPSTTANACYIVPKVYAGKFRKSQYHGIWYDDQMTQVLKTIWSRSSGANNVKWTFSKISYCNNPVFTESDGNISISCITTGSKIYVTDDGSEPDITNNEQEYNSSLWSASSQHYIKAKAVVYDNQTPVSSRVVTLFNKPDVTLVDAGPFEYKADYWKPAVKLTIGETTATTGFTPIYNNNKNAGTANVTVTNSDPIGTLYVLNAPLTEFTIDQVPLTIKANDKSIGYGDEPDNAGVTYSGFVGSPAETETVLGGTLTYTYTTSGDDSHPYTPYDSEYGNQGDYVITPGSLTSTNYAITFIPGTMTVTTKSLGDGALAEGFTLEFDESGEMTLKYGSHTLTKDVDYTIGNEETGTKYSSRTISGMGNYSGTLVIRNAIVHFTTDANQAEWSATFVAESAGATDIGHVLPEGIAAYIISGIEGNWAIPEPLDYIPAGVPVLLVAHEEKNGFLVKDAKSGDVTLTPITDDQKSYNKLKEVTAESAHFKSKQIYVLYKNEFVLTKEGDLGRGKVYMENPNYVTPSSPAPASLHIAWGNVTGIEEVRSKMEDVISERWYTLDGRCLIGKPTSKGLYIVGGKKIVVK